MKKTILILIVLAAVVGGCKYEEGPAISFRSAKNRIYGTHELTSITIDGEEHINDYCDSLSTNYDFHVYPGEPDKNVCHNDGQRRDGIYTSIWSTWILIDNNKKLKTTSIAVTPVGAGFGPFHMNFLPEWEILRLSIQDMKLKTIYNNKEYIIVLD